MIQTSILLSAVLSLASAAPVEGPLVHWEAPTTFVAGLSYDVELTIEAPEGGTVVASWLFTPAAFLVNGKPLGQREDRGALNLPAGFRIEGSLDLGPYITAEKAFKLSFAGQAAESVEVQVLQRAPDGLDFMTMPIEELAGYRVVLRTNRGDILVKVWQDSAPNHARNFLDLSYTGFYDGTRFHRAVEHFMIQGGDPTGTGSGTGPRTLELEPSERPHLRGVLSMARGNDRNSASCQFFIMHGSARHLDGGYSAFGEVVSGMDVVDRIATTPVQRQEIGNEVSSPRAEQVIERALVVRAAGQ